MLTFSAEELLLLTAGACAAVAFSGKGEPTGCVSDCILAAAVAAGLLCLDATSGFDRSGRRRRLSRIRFGQTVLLAFAQPPPRLGTLRGIGRGCRDRRLRAQCFARVNVELAGDRQPITNLISRQRRRQLAAVCAVDLAGVKGGLVSRRELTKSHARQMVAIREMKRAAIKAGKRWPPRDQRLVKLS